ncbi:MAG: 2-amino-4-hydroxy-6-hydroxymethyldihydropteridine diphosphokinase [Chthoniobacteraceae bacterium]
MKTGIALGSNIGDRLENLRQARKELLAIPNITGEPLCSKVYETEPVNCEPDSAPYLNAVVEIDYDGHPISLLDELQGLEKKMGRPSKRPRNAPRTIDLDILYAGNLTLANEEIMIPHPRLHSRRFVLAPLNDIRPDLILPGYHDSISALLAKLPEMPAVAIFTPVL